MFLKLHSITANFLVAGIFLVLLTIGCSPQTSLPQTATPTFSKFLPSTWIAATTITSTLSPTIIPTFTQTLTPTVAPTSRPAITQTLLPSLTPLPTISFDNALQAFEVLLATNGGCRLPCFWGMTPGRTTVAEMNQLVNRFPPDLVNIDSHRYTLYYITHKTGDTSFSVKFFTDDDFVQSIDLGGDTAKYYVTLPKLLNDYGKPTQVLVGPPEFEDYLSMLILYEDQQILGEYFLFPNEFDRNLYCYDPQFSPLDIVTWSPSQNWQDFIDQEAQAYKPLEEVANYDISSFRDTLRNANRAICMKIQTDQILHQ